MVSERMKGLGTARSVIRELFEYGKARAAQVGAENVFDFSIGNACCGSSPTLSTPTPAPRAPPTPGSGLPPPSTAASTPAAPPTGSTSLWGRPPPCAASSTA